MEADAESREESHRFRDLRVRVSQRCKAEGPSATGSREGLRQWSENGLVGGLRTRTAAIRLRSFVRAALGKLEVIRRVDDMPVFID